MHLNNKSKDQFELLLPPTLNFITKEFFLGHLFITVLLFEIRKENVLDQQVYQPVKLKVFASGFPGGAVVENLPANAGDMGSSPGLGRSHMPRSN